MKTLVASRTPRVLCESRSLREVSMRLLTPILMLLVAFAIVQRVTLDEAFA